MRVSTGLMKLRFVLAGIVVAACARSQPAPTTPSTPPAPAPAVAPASTADVERIRAGGWPGSNTHRWGSRFFELRTAGAGVELRIHDEIDFQGSGMTPEQMPPTRHECTAWEPLPPGTARTADAIRAQLEATANGASAAEYYGRPLAPCG